MIGLGIQQIKSKILSEGSISEDELNTKIKAKLDQLSGLISEEGAAHIIANELGIKLFQAAQEGGQFKINDIAQGMRNVDVVGKITRKFDLRTFQTAERQGKVASFILADETGSIRITLWNDQAEMFEGLNEGDVLQIKSGYVRNNNGRAEIHLNDRSKVDINPSGVEVKAVESAGSGYAKPVRKKLNELKEDDQNIEVLGTIVQVYDIRFFESCAECNKRLINKEGIWSCPTHGQVSPDYNYVMNTFVDDGTDSIRATFWKRQIQALLGKEDSQVQEFRTNPAAFEPIKTELLGNIIKLVGNTRMNQQMNSLEFSANLVFNNPDPNEELQRMKEAPAPVKETPRVSTEESVKSSDEISSKVESTVEQELNKVAPKEASESKIQQAIKEDLEQNVVEEAPIVEQRPTPENVGFETPADKRMDKTGIDDDLVSIEDLEDLDDLDNL